MNFDETAHVAAKIQRDFFSKNIEISASASGTPQIVVSDRNTAAVLNDLSTTFLSLDNIGLLQPTSTVAVSQFNQARRDQLSFALAQLTQALSKAASGSALGSTALRRGSSIPISLVATCTFLSAVDAVVNAVNDLLMNTNVETSSSFTTRPSSATTTTSRMKSKIVVEEENIFLNSNQEENQKRREIEIENLKRELRIMKERESIMLTKIRDLEVDTRVKAHVVADTTAQARAVFDENTILRQIAQHNQSLLKEVDALHRCVAENETLNLEIATRDKMIENLKEQIERLKRK
jgi:hypothetical protein